MNARDVKELLAAGTVLFCCANPIHPSHHPQEQCWQDTRGAMQRARLAAPPERRDDLPSRGSAARPQQSFPD